MSALLDFLLWVCRGVAFVRIGDGFGGWWVVGWVSRVVWVLVKCEVLWEEMVDGFGYVWGSRGVSW